MKLKISYKIKFYLSILMMFFILNSCGIGLIIRGVAKKNISVENQVLPPDFDKSKNTLVILMWGDKSYDKYAKKAFDKFYDGKKVFLGFNDLLTNEKYKDVEKYPYVFSQGPGDASMYSGESYSYTFSGSRPFHIYERSTGKFYRSKMTSGFFYRIIQAYAMKLNKQVK